MLDGYGGGASPHRQPDRAGLWTGVPPVCVMDERRCVSLRLLNFYEREAARYRRLLANITTPALKARLAEQAEEHERRAKELNDKLVLAEA